MFSNFKAEDVNNFDDKDSFELVMNILNKMSEKQFYKELNKLGIKEDRNDYTIIIGDSNDGKKTTFEYKNKTWHEIYNIAKDEVIGKLYFKHWTDFGDGDFRHYYNEDECDYVTINQY
jgi:hypothetical protein